MIPARNCGRNSLGFSSELLLQFEIAYLNHCGPSVGATIRELAGEQVFHEFRQLGLAQSVIRFHRVAADRFGDHVLSKSEPGSLRVCVTEVVDNVVEKLRWILAANECR